MNMLNVRDGQGNLLSGVLTMSKMLNNVYRSTSQSQEKYSVERSRKISYNEIVERAIEYDSDNLEASDTWLYVDNYRSIYKVEHFRTSLNEGNEHWYKIIRRPHSLDRFYTLFMCGFLSEIRSPELRYDDITYIYISGTTNISVIIPNEHIYNKINLFKEQLEKIRQYYVQHIDEYLTLSIDNDNLLINGEIVCETSIKENKLLKLASILKFCDTYYPIIQPRPLCEFDNLKPRNYGNILTDMYNLSLIGNGIYLKIITSDDKTVCFDSSLLMLRTDYFKTFFKSELVKDKTTHVSQYNYKIISYFHKYIYNISTGKDYQGITIEVDISCIFDYFSIMTEYCILDEFFGLELLNVLNWKLYSVEEPKSLIEEIKNIDVPSEWKTYRGLLEDIEDAL